MYDLINQIKVFNKMITFSIFYDLQTASISRDIIAILLSITKCLLGFMPFSNLQPFLFLHNVFKQTWSIRYSLKYLYLYKKSCP